MKSYKLTFEYYSKPSSYLDLDFDTETECLNFVNVFNSSNDGVKITNVKVDIFNSDKKPISNIFQSYKVLINRTGMVPKRITIKGDTDSKVLNALTIGGFKIDVMLKDNTITL